jgi:hypothetical protein
MPAEKRFKGGFIVMRDELTQQLGVARRTIAPYRQGTDVFENGVPRSLCHAFAPGMRIPLYSAGRKPKLCSIFFREENQA